MTNLVPGTKLVIFKNKQAGRLSYGRIDILILHLFFFPAIAPCTITIRYYYTPTHNYNPHLASSLTGRPTDRKTGRLFLLSFLSHTIPIRYYYPLYASIFFPTIYYILDTVIYYIQFLHLETIFIPCIVIAELGNLIILHLIFIPCIFLNLKLVTSLLKPVTRNL